MNKPYIKAILAVTRLAFKTGSNGKTMPDNKPGADGKIIAGKYRSDIMNTGSLADIANDPL
jgi:hypothetical protein